MKKLVSIFLLLLVTGLALAGTTDDTLDPAAVHDYTDKSIFYLSQIFGTVGGVLTGQSSQMMGQIFYKLNWGIFLVSGIVVLYAVFLTAIKLSSEGVTVQPGKNALFALIKVALGVGLVIPNSGTGYSLLQNLVMEVVVKGVGLADSVWNYGLEYLNEGGVIWSVPVANQDNSRYDSIITDENTTALVGTETALAAQVFKNTVCMVGSRDPLTSSSDNSNRPYYDVQMDEDKMAFRFPGLTDTDLSGSGCGSVSWNISKACDGGSDTVTCASARAALSALVNVISPAAKSYYCTKADPNSSVCQTGQAFNDLNTDLSPVLFNSMMGYYPTIKVYADMQLSDMGDKSKKFIDTAKAEGWMMAGRYYWDVMQFINDSGKVADLNNYVSTVIVGPSDQALSTTDSLKNIVGTAAKDFSDVSHSAEYQSYVDSLYTTAEVPSEKDAGSKHGDLFNTDVKAAFGASTAVFNPGVAATGVEAMKKMNDIANMFRSFNKNYEGIPFLSGISGHYNPIEFMYKVGQKCIDVTVTIWIVGGASITASVLAYAVCSASNPFGYASQALASWMQPIFMMIATGFWAAGFFLSYYIPLYPYMMFLFASIGWFISVIEAMAAAPIVALGLAHPEDHDLLGKAQVAVMLLLSVFLQPALLVVGLIAGMIFSYVSFQILIYTFSGFMLDIMRDTSQVAYSNDIFSAIKGSELFGATNLLVQPLLIVVFCVIAYILLTQSYSLIYLLRDNVMRWIGAPATGLPSPDQLVSQVKDVAMGGASKVGESMGSASLNTARDANAIGTSVGEQIEKKDNSIGPPGARAS